MKVSNEDAQATAIYLLRAASRPAFWRDVPFDKKLEAVDSLNSIGRSPSELTEWINKYLTAEQINKLGTSIRQRRRRGYGVGKSITISDKAHRILKRLSEVDGCSLSEVIEKRLGKVRISGEILLG
ncbi:TPA: hypothetical protein ODL55_002997 [Escherichia coli]|uniref:hypothetical protein n=2 Tax=Gammaproteobacteria TaxID=1236 RepID=UPI00265BB5E8|nr:hypothetical protein [Salmonella enterica]MDO1222225.1 hypothetical protein [Salmonella enterica subsp. enterica serovar Agona]UAE31720.1 hypothetical protein BFE20_024575 [Salmonella enterica subsp. enterica serovar 4,[5],12:i:-]HCP3170011.1 hypothetical protein [Escherichia coli]